MKRLLAAFALAASACTTQVSPPSLSSKPDMELQIYDVPQGTAGDLRQALARVLGNIKDSNEPSTGRVTLTPDGRMVVLAPEKIQAGVKAIVEQVSKRPASPPPRVDMNYWFVVGKRGKGEIPIELNDIKPALEELQRSQGPMQFRRLEQLKLSTLAGESGRVDNGDSISVRHDVSTSAGVVLVRVWLNAGRRSLDSFVQLLPQQLVVLGQSGWKDKDAKEAKEDEEQTLFYVMRADLPNAPESKRP